MSLKEYNLSSHNISFSMLNNKNHFVICSKAEVFLGQKAEKSHIIHFMAEVIKFITFSNISIFLFKLWLYKGLKHNFLFIKYQSKFFSFQYLEYSKNIEYVE
jgi:hypothetical protein